jgi:hypothetical protein
MRSCLLTVSMLATFGLAVTMPARAFTVEYLAPNATIVLEFAESGYPLPPTTIAGRQVLDWLDAAAPDNPANEWNYFGDVLGYEPGWYTMLYPYTNGSYIYATTAVPSGTVAFAGGADENDGRGQFYVDDALVAQMDYYSAVPVHFVLLVDGLSDAQHRLQLTSLGGAVALYGGAALGPVPEPSSLLALLCGLGGLGYAVRRRRDASK